CCFFFFSSRRRHTRSYGDWSSDVCSSDLCHANQTAKAARSTPVLFQSRREKMARTEVSSGHQPGWAVPCARAGEVQIPHPFAGQIGRASCRERVERWVGEVTVEGKRSGT